MKLNQFGPFAEIVAIVATILLAFGIAWGLRSYSAVRAMQAEAKAAADAIDREMLKGPTLHISPEEAARHEQERQNFVETIEVKYRGDLATAAQSFRD